VKREEIRIAHPASRIAHPVSRIPYHEDE